MKSVIYARISKDEQSKYSIDEQVKRCREYLEREGHELVEVYIDDGYSAKNMKRPALQNMLSDIKKKSFNMITTWATDRLTRETIDGLTMVKDSFRPNGIEFASVTEDIDTSTPDGYMMFTIRLSMAQREREKIAERSSMGQMARAKKGLRNTPAKPYGYDVNPDDLSLVIREDEARVVRMIFDWYAQGWGKFKIARELNRMGIPAPKGHTWYDFIIGVIVRNIIYTGATHYKPKKAPESERIIVENQHEAIIPKEIFQLAQSHTKRRSDNTMSQSSYLFPYSTILKCALCGKSFHGKKKVNPSKKNGFNRYTYYSCSGKNRVRGDCTSLSVREDTVSEILFKYVELQFELADVNKPLAREKRDTEKERKQLEKEIEEVKKKRSRLIDAMVDGKITYEDYSEKIIPIDAQIENLEKNISKIKPVQESSITRRDVVDNIKALRKGWAKMDDAKRKLTIQSLFKRIVIAKVGEEWKILGVELNI